MIESAFSIVETGCRNVKRWRDGDDIERWAASELLIAEGSDSVSRCQLNVRRPVPRGPAGNDGGAGSAAKVADKLSRRPTRHKNG